MKKISRRQATKLLAGGMTAAGMGLSAPAVWAASNMTKLRVGVVPVLDASAFYIAQTQGYFAKERLQVDVSTSLGGGPGMAALVAGQLQFSMSTVTTMLQGREQGLNLTIVTGISASRPYPNDYSAVMVRKDSGIKTGKDVVGKTGASHLLDNLPWVCLRLWIDKTGGDSSKARIIEVHFPQQEDALLGGRVDYVTTNEPFMSNSLHTHPDKLEIVSGLMGTMLPNTIVAAFAANGDYVEKNKDVTAAFTRAYQSAADWAQANKKTPEMVKAVSAFTKLPEKRVEGLMAWPEFVKTIDPANLDQISEAMKRYGQLKTIPDSKALLYKTALG